MSSTHHALYVHIVFSTKNHTGWIDKTWRWRLHAYLGGAIKTLEGVPLAIGGVSDHVHLLASLAPSHRISDVVRDIKRQSSVWVHTEIRNAFFAWQDGYGVFSVSPKHVEVVRKYIENQEEHHRKRSFKEEYLDFLQKGGVQYDERFVW